MRIRYWSSDVCLSGLFGCRLYMGVQKFQDRTISGDLVRLLAKPMSFVGKDEIFDRDIVCLYLCNDILGFDGQHTWVVRALQHHQRLADIRSVKDRRNLAQILGVLVGIADFGEEQAAQVFPPSRRIGEQARPVGYAIDIQPRGKGVGTSSEDRRAGKGGVMTWTLQWWPNHIKKTRTIRTQKK